MKLVRVETGSGTKWASAVGAELVEVEWRQGEPCLSGRVVTGRLVAPVAPPMVLAIGLNYRKHAEETNAALPQYPVVFQKGINSLVGPEEAVLLPRKLRSDKVDFEAELAFVIKKDARNVPREKALDYVLGFTAANDVSARDWQKEWGGGQWGRGKSFDTFCPVGPVLVTLDELPDFSDKRISTRLNGATMQDSRTSDLIFDVPHLIEFLSGSTTLPAGTLVLTGTPSGVGAARQPPRFLQPGDVVEVEIEGIGVLRNPVREETS